MSKKKQKAKKHKKKQAKNKPILFEELEPRLMMSADGLGAASDESYLDDQSLISEIGSIELVYEQEEVTSAEAISQSREIAFIDTGVTNYEQIFNDLQKGGKDGRNLEIVLIDSERDGILQVTETLEKHNDLSAVHIYSHGTGGEISLGDSRLNLKTLLQNADTINAWGDALSDDADMLIYGCDLASTADGEQFVNTLAQLTGADIATSDNLTGSESLGGDWILEYRTGVVETEMAQSKEMEQDWMITLNADFSGNVYSDEGVTNIGAGKTVRIAINGTDSGITSETDVSGAYSIPNLEVSSGDVVTVYLEDETEDAVSVDCFGRQQPLWPGYLPEPLNHPRKRDKC